MRDLHFENLGLRLPFTVLASTLRPFQSNEDGKPLPSDEATAKLFAYLSKRVCENSPSLMLYDFGNGASFEAGSDNSLTSVCRIVKAQIRFQGRTVLGKRQRAHIVAPEVLLQLPDVNPQQAEWWSLACTVRAAELYVSPAKADQGRRLRS
jgi:hypothetical protein